MTEVSEPRVAIIGLGLIGGSLARDLSARGHRVSAFDANADRLATALRSGAVHDALDETLCGTASCEIVVLAVPVNHASDVLRTLAPHLASARLITDVGSTKAAIERTALALGLGDRFVGSHPMAGSHESGWSASRAELFSGACVYICPTPQSTGEALAAANQLWTALGAQTTQIDASEHDIHVAWISHAPHVVSAALGAALAQGGFLREHLGPGGRDVTRLAGSSPDLWTAIACDNAAAIDQALACIEAEIAVFRRALSGGDATALRQQFAAAREWFHAGRLAERV